jgi:HD-GYP domain-containing protein (c-di-GMP phosphodiesterase class II)
VAIYSAALSRRMGLDESDLKLITAGALLHDVGKRHIPGFILRKPGKLSEQERELIRLHPTAGFRELAALGTLDWRQLMIAYQHHEWFGGGGYPVGIAGEEIHLWGRLCAVADVFDALTSSRPYREEGYSQSALAVMHKEASHFDPELLALWEEVLAS